MKRTLLFSLPVAALALFAYPAFALSPLPPAQLASSTPLQSTITFPIAELGNCASREACKAYCEDATHRDACYAFAQTHKLMTKEEIKVARDYILKKPDISTIGQACRSYCSDPAHRGECGMGMGYGSSTPPKNTSGVNDTRAVPLEIQRKYGCSTIAECKALCQSSPDKCPTKPPPGLPPSPISAPASDAGATVFFGLLRVLGL